MKIQQIRNATLKIHYGGITFLVDPWLQDKGKGMYAEPVRPEMVGVKSPLCDLPLPVGEILDGVDCCLVTHIHEDHFTSDYLPKTIKLLMQNEADAAEVRKLGFKDVTAIGEDGMDIGSVHIAKVPALHGDNPVIVKRMGTVTGYLLTGEDKSLYIAGDTIFYSGVEQTLTARKPDVIAVNCCEATMPMGRLLMGTQDLEAVSTLCPDSTVIATHLDAVNHALLDSGDIRRFVSEKGLGNVLVPKNGETVQL